MTKKANEHVPFYRLIADFKLIRWNCVVVIMYAADTVDSSVRILGAGYNVGEAEARMTGVISNWTRMVFA